MRMLFESCKAQINCRMFLFQFNIWKKEAALCIDGLFYEKNNNKLSMQSAASVFHIQTMTFDMLI